MTGYQEQSNQDYVSLGHTWVTVDNCSWWPAQVVDENSVSSCCKPKRKVDGEVLVRLYGTYIYLYVDLFKCQSEFENVLKQNKWNTRDAFLRSLEEATRGVHVGHESKARTLGEDATKNKTARKLRRTAGNQVLASLTKYEGIMSKLKNEKQNASNAKRHKQHNPDKVVATENPNGAPKDDTGEDAKAIGKVGNGNSKKKERKGTVARTRYVRLTGQPGKLVKAESHQDGAGILNLVENPETVASVFSGRKLEAGNGKDEPSKNKKQDNSRAKRSKQGVKKSKAMEMEHVEASKQSNLRKRKGAEKAVQESSKIKRRKADSSNKQVAGKVKLTGRATGAASKQGTVKVQKVTKPVREESKTQRQHAGVKDDFRGSGRKKMPSNQASREGSEKGTPEKVRANGKFSRIRRSGQVVATDEKLTEKHKSEAPKRDTERKKKGGKKDIFSPVIKKAKIDGNRKSTEKDVSEKTGTDSPNVVKTPYGSTRRVKVMQSLGLVAPSGSPFRNGFTLRCAV